MSDEAITLERVFEEAGLIRKWEAQGEVKGEARGVAQGIAQGIARGKIEVAKNFIAMGLPLNQV
ncbi:MAG: hypothetical protein LBF63_04575, partial [Treponema sp.]|nr:hypothetical protein [Treponema sp.]